MTCLGWVHERLYLAWLTIPVQFLSRFDVLSSHVAEEALVSVFVTRPEVVDVADFNGEDNRKYPRAEPCLRPEAFWTDLTPAKSFLIRVFGEHCKLTTKVCDPVYC